jgi:multidrug transporter EmrE-like cation transporter
LVNDDVEKRWHDPGALRAAVAYVVAVIAVAAAAFALSVQAGHSLGWAFGAPAVTCVGALGAFGKTYRDWRAGRTWPIWHGAGWFLLTTTLLSFGIPWQTAQSQT